MNGRLSDAKNAKIILQLAGIEKIRGRDAHHVKVLLGAGLKRDVFFDSGTHLIVREMDPLGSSITTTTAPSTGCRCRIGWRFAAAGVRTRSR
jgi:hypothetical protein